MEKLPREKLIDEGVDKLEDYELLAIILGSGSKKEDVFSLSKRLIKEYGFKDLYKMKYEELSKIDGIKMAKATKLMVIFEIAKRVIKYENEKDIIKSSKDLYNYILSDYLVLKKEVLSVIYVNSKLQIIGKDTFSDNLYNTINLPIKKIVLNAILKDSYGVFLVHNHPSGNELPSKSDNISTNKLSKTLNGLGIILLDHIIIGSNSYFSYSDTNSIDSELY